MEFLYYFSPKKRVGPALRFNLKKLLTPPPSPHLWVTDKSTTFPSLPHCKFHAVETSDIFHHNIAFKGKKDATQVLQESYVPWHNIHVDM